MNITNQYWAGFFDGEGCVILSKYKSRIHNEKFVVGVRVVVTQKEPYVLALMQKQFGGRFKRDVHVFRWDCSKAEEAIDFLKAIQPYVVIKATEVAIALELLEMIVKPRVTNFEKDRKGRKWLTGKAAISLDEIRQRQMLERMFSDERANPKGFVAKIEAPSLN